MSINDERRAVWKTMRSEPIGIRVQYFWDYYKWHTIIFVTLLALAISYTVALLTEPDATVNGMLINAYNYFRYEEMDKQTQELASAFLEQQGKSEDQLSLNMDTSRVYYVGEEDHSYNYDTIQLLLTYTAADSLDYVTGDSAALIDLAYMDFFGNLEDHLPDEVLQTNKEDLLYIDYAVVEQRQEAFDNNLDLSIIIYPNPSKPEQMKDPIPVLICIDNSERMREIYGDSVGQLYFAFTSSDKDGNTAAFLQYLMQGN